MRPLALVLQGQSNAFRRTTGFTDVSLGQTVTTVKHARYTASSSAVFEASGWDTQTTGDLAPLISGGEARIGIESTLGRRALARIGADLIVVITVGIAGTNLVDWDPQGTWPTPENNAYRQAQTAVRTALALYNAMVYGVHLVNGEGDAQSDALANAYPARLNRLESALRADHGSDIIVGVHQLHRNINRGEGRVTTIRNAQQTFNDPNRNRVMTNADDQALDDGVHYGGQGLAVIGERTFDEFFPGASANPLRKRRAAHRMERFLRG